MDPRGTGLHYVSCYNTFPLYFAPISHNMTEYHYAFKMLPALLNRFCRILGSPARCQPPASSSILQSCSTSIRKASRTWRRLPPRSWRPTELWRQPPPVLQVVQLIFLLLVLAKEDLQFRLTCPQSMLPTVICFREEEGRAENYSQSSCQLMS